MSIINKYDVSIVIPVYNKKDYVEECIKTVIDQIGLSFEIIVVDDGSTDGSAEILKQLKIKFPSIKLVSQVNKGLSEARNAGIKISKGKYIAFHDADDHMEAGSMKALFDIAEEFKSDVVGGVYRKIGKNGAYVAQDKYCELLVNINFNERYDDALLYCTNFSACNKLFRRKFIEYYDLYFTPQLYMQDIEYWLKCMFATNKYTQTCVIVSTYNDIEGSWSKKFTRERFDSLFYLYENVSSYYEKHNLSKFLTIKNFAILQGALLFFARHILNEWSRDSDIPDDLFRIQSLLKYINEKDIVLFLNKYPAHVGSYLFPILYSGNFFLARYLSKHFKELRPILRKETDGKIFSSIENIVDLITDIRNMKYSDKPLYNIVLFAQSDLTNIGGVQRAYSLLT
jgi:glycosyltransferase involved in cell wall biosynthesis